MGVNLADKLRTGLSPEQFIESMQQNKEKFMEWYESFEWENEVDKGFF